MDEGAWKAAVHGVAKSQIWLSDFTFTFHFHALEKEMATYSSVLVWRIPGMGDPSGLPSMGLHRVGHDWSDLAAVAVTGRRIDEWTDKEKQTDNFPSRNIFHASFHTREKSTDSRKSRILIHFSCVLLFKTPWTISRQDLLSMEFSRQEYWNGSPFPPPGDLPNPGTEPGSLMSTYMGRWVLCY